MLPFKTSRSAVDDPTVRLRTAAVLALSFTLTGCAAVNVSRTARVVLPGEVELSGGAVASSGVASGTLPAAADVVGRFGILERADMQLRVRSDSLVGAHVAYQLIGDPRSVTDFALTLDAGAQTPVASLLGPGGTADFPVALLLDVPVGTAAVTAALTVRPPPRRIHS
jgi:hypothetical protein